MAKHLSYFETASAAVNYTGDLVAPHVTYVKEAQKSAFAKGTLGEKVKIKMSAAGTIEVKPAGPESNQLWYTTTDNTVCEGSGVINLNYEAIQTSNVYENGKGVMSYSEPIHTLHEEMFTDGSNITSITFPEGLTKITDTIVMQYPNLTSVYLPSTIEEIAENAIILCDNLKVIYYAGTVEQWEQVQHSNSFDNIDQIVRCSNGDVALDA
jgi:hypothetical protein